MHQGSHKRYRIDRPRPQNLSDRSFQHMKSRWSRFVLWYNLNYTVLDKNMEKWFANLAKRFQFWVKVHVADSLYFVHTKLNSRVELFSVMSMTCLSIRWSWHEYQHNTFSSRLKFYFPWIIYCSFWPQWFFALLSEIAYFLQNNTFLSFFQKLENSARILKIIQFFWNRK